MAEEALPPELATELRRGVELFNDHRFWDAHEAWEQIWLEEKGSCRRYVQGLIQLTAAYVHLQRGTLSGVVRLFDASLTKLSAFQNPWLAVDRSSAVIAATRHRSWASEILAGKRSASNVYGQRLDPQDYPKLFLIEPESERSNPSISSTDA